MLSGYSTGIAEDRTFLHASCMSKMLKPRLATFQTVGRRSNPLKVGTCWKWLSSILFLEMNGSDNSAGNDWILGICSVVFDLLQGQKLEDCFPQNALSEDEANDVAFHSFPVCNYAANTLDHSAREISEVMRS